jgi:hypothetical protein
MCFPLWTFVSSVVDAFVHSTQKSHKKKNQSKPHPGQAPPQQLPASYNLLRACGLALPSGTRRHRMLVTR